MEKLTLVPNLTGAIFIMAGLAMLIFPPKKINSLYGYRTQRSMRTIENWNFAQRLCAKLLLIAGSLLLLIGIGGIVFGLNEKIIDSFGLISMVIFAIILIIIIEIRIKKFEKSL
ncbi:MAG: SdpI family protein [Chryseobacterium sp.]|nr:SdpI family protein [Chryseobacterium sp.]